MMLVSSTPEATNVYVVVAGFTGLASTPVFLSTVRISPESGFSATDWTADIIFITVIGGVGRFEGPLLGCLVFFSLRRLFSGYAKWHLIGLEVFADAIMVLSPKGLSGAGRYLTVAFHRAPGRKTNAAI